MADRVGEAEADRRADHRALRYGRLGDRRRPRPGRARLPPGAASCHRTGLRAAARGSPDSLVVCSSYSGNTEETLACYEGAEAIGATRIVATTNGKLAEAARADGVPVIGLPAGLQPRAAVGYMFTVAAEAAALGGGAERVNTEIDSSAEHLEQRRDGLIEQAGELAAGLADCTTVVYGCGLTAPVAYRWKTQLNENGKVPAFSAQLPEADHNEIAGWEGAGACGRFSVVFLEDRDQHPRERERVELTAKVMEPHVEKIVRVETEGDTRTERLLSAVMLGDLVSLHVAAQRGIDPEPVPAIEELKDALGRPGPDGREEAASGDRGQGPGQDLRPGRHRGPRARRRRPRGGRGGDGRDHGPVGLRQEHDAAHARGARDPERGHDRARRPALRRARRRRADPAAA